MKKEELKEIARVGIRAVLLGYEERLADIYQEFPDEFISPTAPVLAKPELRNGNSNGHAPAGKTAKKDSPSYGSSAATFARRTQSAAVLDLIGKSPRPMTAEQLQEASPGIELRGLPPLVRRGYLKHSKKGYTRTSKVFHVDKNHAERLARIARATR